MHKTQHAENITQRFREMVEETGHSLADEHYNQLSLLVEAGIDTALLETLEKTADRLQAFTDEIRREAEIFN